MQRRTLLTIIGAAALLAAVGAQAGPLDVLTDPVEDIVDDTVDGLTDGSASDDGPSTDAPADDDLVTVVYDEDPPAEDGASDDESATGEDSSDAGDSGSDSPAAVPDDEGSKQAPASGVLLALGALGAVVWSRRSH